MKRGAIKLGYLLAILILLAALLSFSYYRAIKPSEEQLSPVEPVAEREAVVEQEQGSIGETAGETAEQTTKVQTQQPQQKTSETLVKIKRYEFVPKDLSIQQGSTVTWLNEDTRQHAIACYKGEKRIFLGKNMKQGQSTSLKFKEKGTFLCVDTIFGIRQNIVVEKSTNPITGAFFWFMGLWQ